MAALHILAVGKIEKGRVSLRVAPYSPRSAAQLNAYLEASLAPQLWSGAPATRRGHGADLDRREAPVDAPDNLDPSA